jgi:hypothetical protein
LFASTLDIAYNDMLYAMIDPYLFAAANIRCNHQLAPPGPCFLQATYRTMAATGVRGFKVWGRFQ